MTDQEDIRQLIEREIQRQLQQIREQNDISHVPTRSQQAERHPRSLKRDSDKDGTLSYFYRWRRSFGTLLWILTILGLGFGCGWNLREILQDMIDSPTVTKITFNLHDELSLPPISVYQRGNVPMLHTERLFKALQNGSLTQAYVEGIVNGLGIGAINGQRITVQPSEIAEAYKEAILRYGSLTEAGLAFQRGYGIACDDLFAFCEEHLSPKVNCCDIFEFLWGLNGPQYALKWNTIYLDAFRGFSIDLSSFPNIKALQKGDFVEEPGNYRSYWIGIGNGVDQTGFDAHSFEVKPSETVSIMLRQKRRNLQITKDCVDLPPKLRYFRDYTISNCFTERCMIDKLSLCNITCEIPLLQLLNPDNHISPACEFDVINSTCRGVIYSKQPQCSTNHGCLFPCNYTELEYSMTKKFDYMDPKTISLELYYDTTEVQTFEETSRLTQWEYLGLISSILDLWLGITIFSLHGLFFRGLSKIIHFKPFEFGKHNSAAAPAASPGQQHEMANLSMRKETEGHEVALNI